MGIFAYLDDLLDAIGTAEGKGGDDPHRLLAHPQLTKSPRPSGMKPSPVRFFTLTGGILGVGSGFGLAVYTAAQWKFIVERQAGHPDRALRHPGLRVLHSARRSSSTSWGCS